MTRTFTVMIAVVVVAGFGRAAELDLLPLGDPARATQAVSAAPGELYDSREGRVVTFDELIDRLVGARVVLIGEEHTAMAQKALHARIVNALTERGRPVVLGMEFFDRDQGEVLRRYVQEGLDGEEFLRAAGWYDRGSFHFDYYREVMETARRQAVPVAGLNVDRAILRAVNRAGLAGLDEEQERVVGEVQVEGSPQHRYLIGRYFGDAAARMPPAMLDNMYAAQCLWDVAMARSILAALPEDGTVVAIAGSGHVAYGLGIARRIADERAAAGLEPLPVVTICPVTAPPTDPDEQYGHPMPGGMPGGGGPRPARFVRSLADIVAVYPDDGGIEAFPRVGLNLKAGEDGRAQVSMVFPDTLAETMGFERGDCLLDVNGAPVADPAAARSALAGMTWGRRLDVLVQRDGNALSVAALLYPELETVERTVAPGWASSELDAAAPIGPDALLATLPADRRRVFAVSRDGRHDRIEVRRGDVLHEVHELDAVGRVVHSLFLEPREGAVEERLTWSPDGRPEGRRRFDRTGAEMSEHSAR